ncbi:MAG: hypothetical protein KGI29_01450 [Pseudomonadota bacterium]|nr:hypothetical protein [Pseudomonadota bacterium]MDE3038140.1 hypothetical protein [Pseudomonadota bacterium]
MGGRPQVHNPDDVARVVMLAFGNMESGGAYWCYVAVKPSRYEEFKRAMESRKYNMQNYAKDGYGEVVVSGEGALPPQDVTRQVARMFNVPVKELFADADPIVLINKKIKQINEEAAQ